MRGREHTPQIPFQLAAEGEHLSVKEVGKLVTGGVDGWHALLIKHPVTASGNLVFRE